MQRIIARIKDGSFAREWMLEQQVGYPMLRRAYSENMTHPIAVAEERFLKALGFWKGEEER